MIDKKARPSKRRAFLSLKFMQISSVGLSPLPQDGSAGHDTYCVSQNKQIMSPVHRHQDGFTLIEIVAVLVLLGILSAVAVPKFFDLQEEAETKAALSAAAEVQSRLDATFSAKVLEGTSCTDAVTFASNLSNLSDNDGSQFGGFEIQKSGEETAPSLQYK